MLYVILFPPVCHYLAEQELSVQVLTVFSHGGFGTLLHFSKESAPLFSIYRERPLMHMNSVRLIH